MFNPISTYRIQFHKGFSLNDFEKLIPYFKKLGVGTIYASPLFAATPGSTHGYDSIDANQINPEIGTYEQLQHISRQLKAEGISWLQDIVPNHMAFYHENAWLMDVLEKGESSAYYSYFDFVQPLYHFEEEPLMVPFLGDSLEEVIAKRELQLEYTGDQLKLTYFDSSYPVNAKTYSLLAGVIQKDSVETELNKLASHKNHPVAYSKAFSELLLVFNDALKEKTAREDLDKEIDRINNNKDLLLEIALQQYYRLCHWQETDKHINFRRFFTVNGLICLNIQHKEVFEDYNRLAIRLLQEGIIQGIRLDHIDGLYRPTQYLQQLRALTGKEAYIVAEKILEKGEAFPEQWPIQGNTGYDFLALVNNLYTNLREEEFFTRFYGELSGKDHALKKLIFEKKRYILSAYMQGELENLYKLFLSLNLLAEEELPQTTPEDLKLAIAEFLIHFPVYRSYGDQYPLAKEDFAILDGVFKEMRSNDALAKNTAISLLEDIFLYTRADDAYHQSLMQFYQRCMQFTGPLMAKGVEDTLMYTYSRFIGHNEVGDSPEAFGISIEEFHKEMVNRQEKWPLSINTTSTHDTKRGEDVRARLNVITGMAAEWAEKVSEWKQINNAFKINGFPDSEDEYFIYQSIVGAYPMPGQHSGDFEERLHAYLEKAFREAKKHSNWANPDKEYETAAKNFVSAILNKKSDFFKSFSAFQQKIVDAGIVNSLGQVLLKFTCPGVPDVYQGCEYWDLSFVDPDNRRPVNYDLLQEALESFSSEAPSVHALWDQRYSGKIKLWLTQRLLQIRQQDPYCFSTGNYIPLEIKGAYKDRVVAFERKWKNTSYLTLVPLALPGDQTGTIEDITALDWKDTRLVLPVTATSYQQVLLDDKEPETIVERELGLQELLKQLPLTVLKLSYPDKGRGAGIMLPVSSLPADYGIGDIGPAAFKFVDFLRQSLQGYWQVLPLTPTEAINGHSPYSSFSGMAGNTALISPDALAAAGLLNDEDLDPYRISNTGSTAYEQAIANKAELLELAWRNFVKYESSDDEDFKRFCEKESSWLNDFALYVLLKEKHNEQPWYQWPKEYKYREANALEKLATEQVQELQKIKWLQYAFFKQWQALRLHCKRSGVKIIGDLPFYVSYDSVDVWVNPELFSLNEDLSPQYVAGVPPDYFNADGQLWGMPVFNWDALKAQNYKWWIKRIQKNLELFDWLRLDHFRAFSAYWQVSAKENTAINGGWITAPGHDLFRALEQEMGKLPLLAEDLGDIDADVHHLRNDFEMPGMKVLQFAFGDSLPASIYAPHNFEDTNYFVYTGTHDNNTIKGWYKNDIDEDTKSQLTNYIGNKVNEEDIHKWMIRLAYASVARIVIVPMQDILGLDEDCRINIPASAEGNWKWRLKGDEDLSVDEEQLKKWTKLYNRDN